MKKLLAMIVLSAFAISAHADCSIISIRDDKITTQFKKFGGWSIDVAKFNRLCEKLNRANARILVNATSAVLANNSIGWAHLTVSDRDTMISSSSFASMNTQVNTYASQDKADALMVLAINEAAGSWDAIDDALAALESERKKVRSAFGKKR